MRKQANEAAADQLPDDVMVSTVLTLRDMPPPSRYAAPVQEAEPSYDRAGPDVY